MDVERVLDKVGGFGRYQRIMLVFICTIYVPLGFFLFAPVFTYLTPPHRCYVPSIDKMASNTTNDITLLEAFIPFANPEEASSGLARCLRYQQVYHPPPTAPDQSTFNDTVVDTNNKTESCLDGWVYMDPEGRSSAVTEFNLVCEHAWKKPLLTSGLIVGLFLGSFVSGPLTDRYGRRRVCLVNLLLNIILLPAFSLVTVYELLVLTIVIIGFNHIILYGCTFVLAQELVDRKHRATVACAINVAYAVGYMLMPLVAYLLTDWRWIIRALAFFFVLYIPYYWFLPESPRWLVSRGKYKDAYKIFKQMARINKCDEKTQHEIRTTNVKLIGNLNDDDVKKKEEVRKKSRRHSSVQILVKNSVMRSRSAIICCLWNVSFLAYYALGYNTSNLGGNNYWNCFVAAALEIPSHFLVVVSIQKLGRRFGVSGYLGLAGIFCGLSPAVSAYNGLSVAFAMVGKFFASSTMGILYLYTSELYPTLLRNTGIGLASMSSRFGSICAPFLVFAGENAGKSIPFYVIAALSLITSGLCLFLPETKQSPLPDTMLDAVNLEKFRLFSYSCQRTKQNPIQAALTSRDDSVTLEDDIPSAAA